MCIHKPSDPYQWLTQWLQRNKPRNAAGLTLKKEPVLKGLMLKCDDFEDIHKLPDAKPHHGVWNWRQTSGGAPVYGVGQCHEAGLLFLLQDMAAKGAKKVFWANCRDEPMVYINGEPCAPRAEDALNVSVDHLFSIEGEEVEAMESRLKRDVLGFSGVHRGEIGVYYQMAGMTNELRQKKVTEVRSARETFEWLQATSKAAEDKAYDAQHGPLNVGVPVTCVLREGSDDWLRGTVDADLGDGTFDVVLDSGERLEGKIRREIKAIDMDATGDEAALPRLQYYRIPITDETPPEEKDFDDIVAMTRDFASSDGANSAMVFTCQMGRGRTTTAMVAASIVWYASRGWANDKIPFVDPESPNHMNGEWKGVIRLMAMMEDGLEVKALVDQCIDECAHIQNLREAIKDCKDQADTAPSSGARSNAFWLKRGQNYLERYCYLLLFANYARTAAISGFSQPFSNWMMQHWGMKRVMKQLVLE